MRYLHSIQILVFCFIVLFTGHAGAQVNKGNINFRKFQDKSYYFGLTFGYNNSNFQLEHSKKFILNDSFNISEGLGGPGLNVSMVTNMKLGDYFDFRFLPGFSFVGRKFFYVSTLDQIEEVKSVEGVLVQAPLQVRFKSEPFHDMRMFVLAGAKYTYDVASNARIQKEQANRIIRISPHDFSVEVGAGAQFFFPFFIFSPEIKFSQGIGNILIYNSKLAQSTVLEKVLSRTFTISVHFEG
ncbi:MAG TPA: outer membrane beta-barrel protein [Saprospiraceae bacterium]|nr:outer membrane beta-barrel protein [Saprospiraceae bacterium]